MNHTITYFIAFSIGYSAKANGSPYWYIFIALPVMFFLDKAISKAWSKIFKSKPIMYQ